MAASSSADLASPGNRAHLTPRVRLKSAQTHVYAAASAQTGLRCGDLVDVEWEATWYPGVVTDIPAPDTLAVSYTNGDFEDSVPQNVARLRDIQPKKKPYQKSHDKRKKHTVNLSDAANAGDIGLVMQALKEGSDPKGVDDFGYTPLHWAAAPDDGMPGDTIARRACITILARLGDVDARDRTHLGLRGVQHSVTRNFVGCVKAFAHVGADMTATVHWGQHCKSHASLRELLRLGVTSPANKDLWEGCTPLMLAAAQNDTYGMQILLDHQEATRGADAVYSFVNAVQAAGSKLRATALHHAADAAADLCTELLLERGARVEARSSRGETALTVAKRRAAAAEKLPTPETYEAAVRCVEILEGAIATAKAERRREHGIEGSQLPPPSSGSGTGKRKGKGMGKAAMAAAAARAAASGGELSEGMSPRAYLSEGMSPRASGFTSGDLTGGEMTGDDELTGGGYTDGGGNYTDGGGGYTDGGGNYTDGGGGYTDGAGGGEEEGEEDGDFWDRPLGELFALLLPPEMQPPAMPPTDAPGEAAGADDAAAGVGTSAELWAAIGGDDGVGAEEEDDFDVTNAEDDDDEEEDDEEEDAADDVEDAEPAADSMHE